MVLSTPFPPCDGIGYHVYSLMNELGKRGHKISVLTRSPNHRKEIDNFEYFKIFRGPFIPIYPFHIPIHGRMTKKTFKGSLDDFDIVHYHTPLVPFLDIDAPSVVTVHSSMIEEINQMESNFFVKKIALNLMTRTFTKYYMKNVMKRSSSIIAVSDSTKKEISKYYGINENVDVIHNGVDTDYFHPINDSKKEDFILYTGRLDYRKGLFDLVDAFKIINHERNLKLVICGKGRLKDALQKRVMNNGLIDVVEFVGFVKRDELLSLYQRAKLFVTASAYETGPLTALEAMSCGTPIVVTKVGIMPDIIKDGVNGSFVNKNDSHDLASKCLKIIDDDVMRLRIGGNARRYVEENCNWSTIVDRTLGIYKKASEVQSSK